MSVGKQKKGVDSIYGAFLFYISQFASYFSFTQGGILDYSS
jgi:hypothetical protein